MTQQAQETIIENTNYSSHCSKSNHPMTQHMKDHAEEEKGNDQQQQQQVDYEEEDESDNDDDWLFAGLQSAEETGNDSFAAGTEPQQWNCNYSNDLDSICNRLRQEFAESPNFENDCRERTRLVNGYMGTMALCRGQRGEELRKAGAIDALLWILQELLQQSHIPTIRNEENVEQKAEKDEASITDVSMELAMACLGALRDLACGSAANRSAIREYRSDNGRSGLHLLANYLKRYHEVSWECIAVQNSSHLRLLTNVIGVFRNVSHSTRDNCMELHQLGVSSMLTWRLLQANNPDSNLISSSLPDANQPWREAAYRSAGTLINISEKCHDCAQMCGSNQFLVPLLMEAWGGASVATTAAYSGDGNKISYRRQTPLLHLGLAAILHSAKRELPTEFEKQHWGDVLAKEDERRRIAQAQEEERKKRMSMKHQ